MSSREPSDLWQDEYQSKFLSDDEESRMQDLVEETLERDFQDVLFESTQVNVGYNGRSEDLRNILKKIHRNSGSMENFEALGEYLYILAYEYALDSVEEDFER